jgi:hypothetical protein
MFTRYSTTPFIRRLLIYDEAIKSMVIYNYDKSSQNTTILFIKLCIHIYYLILVFNLLMTF